MLEPGETLLLELNATPNNPYQTEKYPMMIITHAVEHVKHQPTKESEKIEITGISRYRHYRPIVGVVLGLGLIVLVVVSSAVWLISFDFLTWLIFQGQYWFGLI